jgi:hypothetical protein
MWTPFGCVATLLPVVQGPGPGCARRRCHQGAAHEYVQGPSSHPSQHQASSANATTNHGVGAFLMAGVETVKLPPACDG